MLNDPVSDLLTRIRNAQQARHESVEMPRSRQKSAILQLLVDEGYVARFEEFENEEKKPQLRAYLRYEASGIPVVREIQRISKPGRRVYVGKENIPTHRSGLGTIFVSTSQGLITDREARKRGVGGELVCSIF